ncbi:hypothetical protein FAGKG844_120021 [Frankia sp. AgKG'84/4]
MCEPMNPAAPVTRIVPVRSVDITAEPPRFLNGTAALPAFRRASSVTAGPAATGIRRQRPQEPPSGHFLPQDHAYPLERRTLNNPTNDPAPNRHRRT